jgi:hypothetical protein
VTKSRRRVCRDRVTAFDKVVDVDRRRSVLLFCDQVVRESRIRDAVTSGTKVVAAEKANFAGMSCSFFDSQAQHYEKTGSSVTAEAALKAKAQSHKHNGPAQDKLRQLQRMLSSFGHSLGSFGPEAVEEWLRKDKVPPVLTLTWDQEQTQWTAGYYLLNHVGVHAVLIKDPFHRRCNDVIDALLSSGTYSDYICAILYHNVRYGPFRRSHYAQDYISAAADVGRLCSPDDPILLLVWPRIMKERGYGDSREERQRFLDGLAQDPTVIKKGYKSSTGRWFSWNKAQAQKDENMGVDLFLGLMIGKSRGYFRKYDDVFLPWRRTNAAAASGSGEVAEAAAEGSASASSGAAPAAAASSSASSGGGVAAASAPSSASAVPAAAASGAGAAKAGKLFARLPKKGRTRAQLQAACTQAVAGSAGVR